jgi:hypothetical protein
MFIPNNTYPTVHKYHLARQVGTFFSSAVSLPSTPYVSLASNVEMVSPSLHRLVRGRNFVKPQLFSPLSSILRPPHPQLNSIALQRYSVKGQTRSMGSVSAIDSAIFRTLFGTDEIRQVFPKPFSSYIFLRFFNVTVRYSKTSLTSVDVLMPRQP